MNPIQMNQMMMNQMGMNQMGMNQMGMNQMGMNQMGINNMGMNQMGMNQMGMNQMGMNQMGMNQMGMNQMGMNNQQNQFDMDKTTLDVKNIVQPYEKEIQRLQEIIRQKDFEIAVLKQKLSNNSSNINYMNLNPMMMNQNINPIMMSGILKQQSGNKGKKLGILLKTENGDFNYECFERDKVSILFEKINKIRGFLIYKYKVLKSDMTFEENGINKNDSIIYLKKDCINLFFKDTQGNVINLPLGKDCPLQIALIYYLIKSDNLGYLYIEGDKDSIIFLFNGMQLDFYDTKPIENFFLIGSLNVIRVVYQNQILGAHNIQ